MRPYQRMQTLSLTVVIVATFTLPGFSQDGTIIHFDFVKDGEILPWRGAEGFATNLELVDGLVLQSTGIAIAEGAGLDFTNTSIRAQFQLIEGQSIGLGVRGPGGSNGTVAATVEPGSGENRDKVRLQRTPPADIIEPVTIDLQVDIEDIVMQLDSVEQSLEVRVWKPGDPMPTDATMSTTLPDGLTTSGIPWLVVPSAGGSTNGVFREVWVSDMVIPEPSTCDFNADEFCDVDDLDVLIGEIAAGVTDILALTSWLSSAAEHNGFSQAYLVGDSNLDGSVNSTDLNNLALKWQQNVALWSGGDFTADGAVDSADLNALALNWRQSIPLASSATSPVPEPSALFLTVVGLALAWRR